MIQNFWLLILKRNIATGGGSERRLLRLYDLLSKKSSEDYKYKIITYSENQDFVKENMDSNNIVYLDSNSSRFKTFFSLLKLILLKSKKNDFFQMTNTSFFYVFLSLILKLNRVRIITSITAYTITHKRLGFLVNLSTYIQFLLSDKIEWLYPYYKTYWDNAFISKKSVATPCSFTNYNSLECDIDDKENIILFCSRMTTIKQPLLALRAIKKIHNDLRENNYKMIFLGGGPLLNKCKEYVKENNLGELVIFYQTTNPVDFFKRSKIFLSIQKYENYPSQSLLEAIASDNIVIATNVGETKSIVNGEGSILINSTEHDLSKAIKKAIYEYDSFSVHLKKLKEKIIKTHNIERVYNFYVNKLFR